MIEGRLRRRAPLSSGGAAWRRGGVRFRYRAISPSADPPIMDSADIQRVFQTLPGLILVLKADSTFTIAGASNAYLRATYIDSSAFGRSVFEVFPINAALPEATDFRNLRTSLERVVAQRAAEAMPVQRHDVQLPGTPGTFEERYWSIVNSPILAEDGSVEFIIHTVEEATAKANRDALGILDSITEGFFTLNRQWQFDYVNREAHRILGVAEGSLAGRVIWDAYPGLQHSAFHTHYKRSMFGREKTSFTAFYDQQDRWYEVTVFPAHEGISVFFRNVT
ncbi:MAG: PAS domain-containing protein, partial [Burkholderiaceae bacterium]